VSEAVVFQGLNALDFIDIRANVVRIPEVTKRISEAQKSWDASGANSLDLCNFIASEDRVFLGNIRLKSMASAIVQVGLFDRYLRFHQRPNIFVGNTNGDSAMLVTSGKISFSEMISTSPALKVTRPLVPMSFQEPTPYLSGISLTQYGAIFESKDVRGEVSREELPVDKIDPSRIVTTLVGDYGVRRFVNFGPGNLLFSNLEGDLRLADIQVLESIDLDPMLSWFWQGLRHRELALAQ
jgi:hypothetical protein